MKRVLIVEDDREMRQSLLDLLEADNWQVSAVSRASEALKVVPDLLPDVVLSDVRMPGLSGIDLLHRLSGADMPPVVLISAHGDIPMAVDAMRAGAYSFVEKPYDPRRLLTILSHAAEQHQMRGANARLQARLMQLSGLDRLLLGQSAEMAHIRQDVADYAASSASLLIHGETGTGKELVARAMHDLGPNATGPFVPVNTAELTAATLAAATASARGGSLFLDEICACPPDIQAMLLRQISDGPSDPSEGNLFRVLSATNETVETAVSEGRLRTDLLFRLNTLNIHLPALRNRRDDLVLLTTHFVAELAQLYEVAAPELSPDDIAALLAHDWPGNVRELRSVAERRVLAARRGTGSIARAIHPDDSETDVPHTLREAVAAFERELIGKAIVAHSGRMDAVAEALGIGRRTLNEKIVKLDLDKDALI
ncbi:MAG: sigma-54 dependent transcriptional regulator [Pseudomonadota bacterium]